MKIETTRTQQLIYINEFKNWEFAKEVASIFASGTNGIAREQAVSEDQTWVLKPTID